MLFETWLCPDKYLLFTEALTLSIQETFEVLGHIVGELPSLILGGNTPRKVTHALVGQDLNSTTERG